MKYWNGEGQYQDLFDKHWKRLVPESGRADVNQVEEMDEDEQYYTDYSINRWWEEYFDDIEEFAGLNVDRLKTKILGCVQFDQDGGLSDMMDDYIDHIVLRVDNQPVTK